MGYDQSNTDAKDFASSQVHYFLGENPKKMSYVVGFGDLYPQRPHHRGASCPQTQMACGDQFRDSGNPNPNILFGALVGGPDNKDEYKDDRNDYEQSEVALDYNACFQGLVDANVGIACTPSVIAISSSSSTSTLTNVTRPSICWLIISRTGAIALHGPHHSAKKSTTTRPPLWVIVLYSSSDSIILTIFFFPPH